MSVFRGSGVALVTPFHEDKSVNFEMLEYLVERQITNETDAIVVCGTTGEPATMSEKERLAVIKTVVAKTSHRIPVIAGVGCNATERTISFVEKVNDLGVDGMLIVTPYYNKATQNGLHEHYRQIAAHTTKPIIIYNVPSRTGCNMLPETVARIADSCPNVTGIKEASGNISQVAKLASLVGDRLDIYSGNDDQIVPVMSLGGSGVISVLANLLPKNIHDITKEMLNGDYISAKDAQLSYEKLIEKLFTEVNPIPVKAALNMMGMDVGPVRLPLTELEETHKNELKRAMSEVGIRSL